jgi:hypothetical protein
MKKLTIIITILVMFGAVLSTHASDVVHQARVDVAYALRESPDSTVIDFDVETRLIAIHATASKEFIEALASTDSERSFADVMESLVPDGEALRYFPGEWYAARLPQPYYEIRSFADWQGLLADLEENRLYRLAPGVFLHEWPLAGTGTAVEWSDAARIGVEHADRVLAGTRFVFEDNGIGRYIKTGRLRIGRFGGSVAFEDTQAFAVLDGSAGIRETVAAAQGERVRLASQGR